MNIRERYMIDIITKYIIWRFHMKGVRGGEGGQLKDVTNMFN